ncbi:uncharacterized protein [Halyomorpha halys]|uniref:uncharacterized protein isoform X2 n=1 Tax=Halyomorpha halys TaxID=286706 RepID=UPI0034D15B81
MSAIIPGCDSDEEVFWGPVTARELEIIWRSRMANKKGESANPVEKFIKKPEGLIQFSDQDMCSMSSNNSVQEVPSLQDLRNSSDTHKVSFEGNDKEDHTEDSEHEPVGNESTLPLLEASIEINQDHEEIQNFNNSSSHNSNNDISNQVHVKYEPESSAQLDDSLENPELNKNIGLVHSEETINSVVENRNETPLTTTKVHLSDDVCMSSIDTSKECCDPTGEEIEASHLPLKNNNISSSNDCGIEELCKMSHDSLKPSQVGSIDVMDSVQSESVISQSENVQSLDLASSADQLKTSGPEPSANLESLNQSVGQQVGSVDVLGSVQPESVISQSENVQSMNLASTEVLLEPSGPEPSTNLEPLNHSPESSDEKSFVSVHAEEDDCISSSNSQYSSTNQDCAETLIVKNKENEEPPSCVQSSQDCARSKIPVFGSIKSTFLKPSKLQPTSGTSNEKWLNDLKRKKIPKPKKPDYMVSPAKLGGILKSRNQPIPVDKPALDMKRPPLPKVASSTPKPIPGSSRTLVTPRKKQFEYVKSPISQYIRTGTGIPTAKSLPALQSPNIPVPITVKQTPVQKLPPKFYSSAEKLVIKPGSASSVLRPAENRSFLTPKIFKHQGRVPDLKKPGDINVVTPRAVRKTNLTETSFACLPESSKGLEVSVLEEL